MLKNDTNSFSERYNRYKIIRNGLLLKKGDTFLKPKKQNNEELNTNFSRSIDCLMKTTNKVNLQYIDRYIKNNNNKNNQSYNKKQILINEKLNHKFFKYLKKRNNKKEQFQQINSKKKLLEKLVNNDKKNDKEKSNYSHLNGVVNSSCIQIKQGNLLVNNSIIPDLNINKKRINKVKNVIEEYFNNININLKNYDIISKKIIQEKLNHINLNKTALFQKIKFAGLKNFCSKDIKPNDNNVGEKNKNKNHKLNLFQLSVLKRKSNTINNDNKNNNYKEITINHIREKVRNYFIGKFDNIKDFFDDWNEQKNGKISFNDIYNYLNNKISLKISMDETKKLFKPYCKKNFFELEDFKYLFFEEPSNEKLSIKLKKSNKIHPIIVKCSSERILFNNKIKNIISLNNQKYEELLYLLKNQDKTDTLFGRLLTKYNNGREKELNYKDFCNLINKIINNDNKQNYNNAIKKLYKAFKLKNKEKINIKYFFKNILNDNNKNDENNKYFNIIHYSINNNRNNRNSFTRIKNNINKREPFPSLNNTNSNINYTSYKRDLKHLNDLKESNYRQTNYYINKTKNDENKKNIFNINNKNTNNDNYNNSNKNNIKNKIKECKSLEITKIQKNISPMKKHSLNESINDNKAMTQVNSDKYLYFDFSKSCKLRTSDKNKNLDIINLL